MKPETKTDLLLLLILTLCAIAFFWGVAQA